MPDMQAAEALVNKAMELARKGQFGPASELIKQALRTDPAIAQGRNVLMAHLLVLGTDWGTVSGLVPRHTNSLLMTGWLNSLQAGRPVNAQGSPIPWFTYPAIDFLEQRVKPTWNILEWGCGASTLWWAPRVERVFSVEHDTQWHQAVAGQAPMNAKIHLATEVTHYVNAPRSQGLTSFDVAVVDGSWRNECAREAATLVKESGLIVFDNTDRRGVREGVEYLGAQGWKRIDFFGLIPSYLYRNCTSVFYRDEAYLKNLPAPCEHRSSLGPSCAQAMGE
jgi:hypothetical protein